MNVCRHCRLLRGASQELHCSLPCFCLFWASSAFAPGNCGDTATSSVLFSQCGAGAPPGRPLARCHCHLPFLPSVVQGTWVSPHRRLSCCSQFCQHGDRSSRLWSQRTARALSHSLPLSAVKHSLPLSGERCAREVSPSMRRSHPLLPQRGTAAELVAPTAQCLEVTSSSEPQPPAGRINQESTIVSKAVRLAAFHMNTQKAPSARQHPEEVGHLQKATKIRVDDAAAAAAANRPASGTTNQKQS